ncbi:MAG: hypothetical protein HYR56_08885 [Acidobacteria bacterium]|nr:hypothetical protein [Acidobacteriota bacterium]MBI3422711.1 hypothetical protein [Acidobacteriota bacterium]
MRTSHKLTHTRSKQFWLRLLALTLLVGALGLAAVRSGGWTAQADGFEAARTRLQEAKAQYLARPSKENNAKFDQALAAYKSALKAHPGDPAVPAQGGGLSSPYVSNAVVPVTTQAVSAITQNAPVVREKPLKQNKNEQNELPIRTLASAPGSPDAALQSTISPGQNAVTNPIQNFDGPDMDIGSVLFGGRFAPPDTNADVGPNHVVVTTNGGVTIYNKTGVVLVPQFRMSQLTPGIAASLGDDGDPVVLYDPLADRWILTQFGLTVTNNSTHEIIAISQTGDPTGAYFAYDFLLAPGRAGDYPHLGVWPDAYYMSTNDFNTAFTAFLGAGLYAFERNKMLAGAPALLIGFSTGTADGGMLPTDIDGVVPPPVGAPNLFVEFDATEFGAATDLIRVFEFRPNFANPGASTVTVRPDIPTLAFDANQPASRAVIEQPAPSAAADNLDAIADRLMHRLAYRTLPGGTQSYVLNFTVNVDGAGTTAATYQAGVRWMELRRDGAGVVTINQQATYAPGAIDGATGRNLWMASVAQDGEGNIGLAASASSTTLIPTAIYTGRLAGDAASTLTQGEVDAMAAVTRGVQTGTGNRWGDYSSLSVDPADECTFWGAFEYVDAPTASFDWNTRVFSFKVNPACVTAAKGSLAGQATNANGGGALSGVLVSVTGGGARTTNASGNYTFTAAAPASTLGLAPGTYTATCSKAGFSTASGSVTVVANATATFNCALAGVPMIEAPLATVAGGNGNGTIETDECNTLNVRVTNNGGAAANNVTGTLTTSTPGVTIIAPATQSYGTINAGANGTAGFQVSTAPTFICGTTINFTLTVNYTGGSTVLNFTVATTPAPLTQYTFTSSAGNAMVPGTTLVPGSQDDDAALAITLPFTYSVYGTSFTTAFVSTNGNVQFGAAGSADFSNTCPLPGTTTDALGRALMPYWDDMDLRTTAPGGANNGVYTSTSGSAPNRIFNIEWRGVRFGATTPINYEVRLFEGQQRFDVIYGTLDDGGASASVGVQSADAPTTFFTSASCNTAGLTNGQRLSFTAPVAPCATGGGACLAPIPPVVKIADPAICTGPGGVVGVTATVTNPAANAINGTVTATLLPGLVALPGTCVATAGGIAVGTCTITLPSTIAWTGAIPAGQALTLTYNAQVDSVAAGTQLCVDTTANFGPTSIATVRACTTVNCQPLGPGTPPSNNSPVSDQRAGSVLFYNLYTSTVGSPSQNTSINITNIEPNRTAYVHLFFVDGATCSVADGYICLTPNQTASFQASDLDPGTTGYLIAVAVDRSGCPINFNYLIGDEFVKLTTGHQANLAAEAIQAVAGGLTACTPGSPTATLAFNGTSYGVLPRVLAVDNVGSRSDANDTVLIVNSVGGDLRAFAQTLRPLFGIIYDDAEIGLSFTFAPGTCQFRSTINNSFPKTTPRFESWLPSGRSAWFRFYVNTTTAAQEPILGAVINRNPNATSNSGAFNQGHNLHKLNSSAGGTLTIPVFPVTCQ